MAEDLFGIVGTVVASAYHVESVVAEGGFGIVYRARHGGFRAPVALKCLKVPQHLGHEQQRRFLEQFRAEGEVMFRLSASIPNVVRPLHVDAMNTPSGAFVPFLVLEWLDGETLDAILRARVAAGKRPLPVAEALELIEPVGRALERAHHFNGPAGSESIAHCDIKPENVFVAKAAGERLVKILDFGVAKVRGAATRAAAGASSGNPEAALFTPAYGAPEQWNPKAFGEVGPWTDVWGLGLTLVETLVGRPVIAGDHTSVMRQALDPKRRPTPGAHGVVVGDALEAVFLRALAVDPRERYPDAGALLRALKDAASGALEVAAAPAPEIPDLVPISRRPSAAQKIEVPAGAGLRTPSGAQRLDLGPAASSAQKIDLGPGRTPSGAQRLDLGPLRKPSGAHKLELDGGRSASGTHKLDLPTVGTLDFDDDSSGESSGLSLDLPEEGLLRKGSLAPIASPPSMAPFGDAPVSVRGVPIASNPPVLSSAPPQPNPSPVPVPASPVPQRNSLASPPGKAQEPPSPKGGEPSIAALRSPVPIEIERPLSRRLLPGLALAGSSIALTVLDRIYAAVQGEVFSLGPVRTSWVAAALLITGLGLAAREFVPRS